MKGISAVIAAILMLMITMALAGVAYFYISGIFASKTTLIEAVGDVDVIRNAGDATKCDITWNVRNIGTATVSVTITKVSSAACGLSGAGTRNIVGGETSPITATVCASNNNHVFKVAGPSNTVNLIAFCA